MSTDKVEAVERALAVLDAFHADRAAMTLSEIASATGFYKSTILRLAGSLERLGYLIRAESGVFRLGPAVWRLGSIYRAGFNLGEAIDPNCAGWSKRPERRPRSMFARANLACACSGTIHRTRRVTTSTKGVNCR